MLQPRSLALNLQGVMGDLCLSGSVSEETPQVMEKKRVSSLNSVLRLYQTNQVLYRILPECHEDWMKMIRDVAH